MFTLREHTKLMNTIINSQIQNTMKIQISDFDFKYKAYGAYKVTFTSPITGKQWSTRTTNMRLIDATKNSENPTQKDLKHLKEICKTLLL